MGRRPRAEGGSAGGGSAVGPGGADPYEVLGVPRDADDAAVRAAYRRCALLAHPDKGGSEEVRVDIPREHSINEKVLIVGELDAVTRAKAYIDKLIWNAENQSKGRDKADNATADPWGDEEPEEPWMKSYMYKR
mmetsp:Transcript_35713/g.102624  ORF Transcript_35713/g.102624 Transcript_35713/m.102624 type:complete len:134 (-) Transcript_35713:63-464(-)